MIYYINYTGFNRFWALVTISHSLTCEIIYDNFRCENGQFQCLAKFLLKHEKQNPSLQLKRSYQK